MSVRKCFVCGCTDADCRQCIELTGKPCHWVAPALCSTCAEIASVSGRPIVFDELTRLIAVKWGKFQGPFHFDGTYVAGLTVSNGVILFGIGARQKNAIYDLYCQLAAPSVRLKIDGIQSTKAEKKRILEHDREWKRVMP